MIRFPTPALALLLTAAATQAAPPPSRQALPAAVLAAAPASAWKAIDPDDLLILDVKGGGRVVLALSPAIAPIHVANIRAMARAHYYDGALIERVQENYVTQWGVTDEKRAKPADIVAAPPAEYERPARGLDFRPIPYRDTFAAQVGFVDGFPAAQEGGQAWLTHCYSMVGVGRGMTDTGDGGELYAIIGHSPRALDRNIAVVGRVIAGMENLTARPRGTEQLGFYKDEAATVPFARVRLAAELPPAERPRFAMLDTTGPTFAAWVQAKANRKDDFFTRPAGAMDLCNLLPPVKDLDAPAK